MFDLAHLPTGQYGTHHDDNLGVCVQQDSGGVGPVLQGGPLADDVADQRRQPQAQPIGAADFQLLWKARNASWVKAFDSLVHA